VTLIVVILNFTIVPIPDNLMWQFIIGFIFVTIGLTLFLVGVDLGITPLGMHLGPIITRWNKLWVVMIAAFVLGFIISFAEPDLIILGKQIEFITSGGIASITIISVVSLGIAVLMMLGFLRIVYNIPLFIILNILYAIILILAIFTQPEFLAIAFDTSGATTGALAVPFILSLSMGLTSIKKDRKASEKDSFGLVSIVSAGAIISVMILNLIIEKQEYTEIMRKESSESLSVAMAFINNIPGGLRDSFFAFLPLVVIFILLIKFTNAISKTEIKRISFGFIYSVVGLGIFFIGIHTGFMDVGSIIGGYLVSLDSYIFLIGIGFLLGVFTIIAEPAVHVLTQQIEEVTAGFVKKSSVLIALSIGVGFAIALSVLRIVVVDIQLWHYLLPGYIIALGLTFVVPKLFVGIAFDAGGVATGPITATFILAFINGAAHEHSTASILIDGFGMIAMVALMPIITLQILGLLYRINSAKKEV
jgi:hypothetical protein